MAQTTTTRSNGEQPSNETGMENKSVKASMGKVKPSYKHIPHSQKPPHLVAKRNARERRRVQAVNQAFYKLRKSVPIENRNKRVSKVKTLQRAIDYIRRLERILAEDGDEQSTGQPPEQVSGGTVARGAIQSAVQDELVKNSEDGRSRLGSQTTASERTQTSDSHASNRKVSTRSRKQQAQPNGKSKQLNHTLPPQAGQQQQQQINQAARVHQIRTQQDTARVGLSAMAPPRQEDNNYTVCMKPATTLAADSGHFGGATSNAATFVSYGRGNGRNVGPSPPASHQHFSSGTNHYGQYYVESPTSSSQLMVESLSAQQHQQYAYNNHLPQLPPNGLQGCEISSSSLMTNGPLYGNYLPSSYQYGALDGERSAAPSHDTSQQQRLVNHNPYNKPVESGATTRTSNGQQRFQQLAPVFSARHYQNSARDTDSAGQLELGSKTAQAKMMLLLENASLISSAQQLEQQTQNDKLAGAYQKQHGLESATSMPADSTSSVAMKDSPDKGPQVVLNGARSPPASFCSSSPTASMSSSTNTTIKSLDLSGGSSAIFNRANMNGSDKLPTTSAGTPVVCRQRKSDNESGAHSTTGRGGSAFMWRQTGENTTGGQQQVNNYNGRELPDYAAANLLYESPSSNSTADYSRASQNQLNQADAERTIKLTEGKSLTATSLHASSLATNNLELLQARHRSGSRSSSTISPNPTAQQLVLVGGNYLANNNLHGNDQHSGQLFQHHPAHYNYQQNDHYHQIQHQNHNSHHQNPGQQQQQQQQQQPLYQGQHFLGNLQSGHQQLNSNHLNDHNNHHHHHLQSDSFPSELRQSNANTLELVAASNTIPHQQLERLVASSSTASITAPQYTVQPL